MMQVCTLASGSSGNALLVRSGGTAVLVDVGISARRITTALREIDVDPRTLSGILITHEHSDHISGLTTLTKQLSLPVYTTAETARQLCYRIAFLEDLIRPLTPGQGTDIGCIWAHAFRTPHDTDGSVGFSLSSESEKVTVVTDLGHVTPDVLEQVRGSNLLVAEANHDVDWLQSGSYPYYLKKRILGDFGHLSNEASAELVCSAVESGTSTVLLAHLSSENNTPARAHSVVEQCLKRAGVDPESDIHLSVAPRSTHGPVFDVTAAVTHAFPPKGATLC